LYNIKADSLRKLRRQRRIGFYRTVDDKATYDVEPHLRVYQKEIERLPRKGLRVVS
jgi:hypothetical protein